MAVVVITGASSGIGEATARELAAQGHKLVLAARRVDRLDALAGELTGRGPAPAGGVAGRSGAGQGAAQCEVLTVQADMGEADQIEALARQTVERFGAIDVWINNAGLGPQKPWLQADPADLKQVVDVNLTAPILAVRAVVPYMKAQGRGHFINVASVAGHIGTWGLYSATKFGLRGLSEALRRELMPYGIKVSVVSPGFIATAMTKHRKSKMPGPEIVARAIARLVRRPRREVVVPGSYRFLIWLNAHFPWLVDQVQKGK